MTKTSSSKLCKAAPNKTSTYSCCATLKKIDMEEKTQVTRYLVIRVKGYVPNGTDDQEIDNVINNVDYTIRGCEDRH
jgi:hypothetical protein